MANVLVINDLGKGFGHVARSGIILNGLINAGHRVSFASNKLSESELGFIDDGVECYTVPKRSTKGYGNKVSCTYAEYLLSRGFNDPKQMSANIRKYHALFKKADPDVVILDHAPVAAMALRSYCRKHVPFFHVGSSFTRPPLLAPFPVITPWEYIQPERIELADKLVATNIHVAMKTIGSKQISDPRELFTEYDLHDTWEEFDHFRNVTDASYIGPVYPQYAGQNWQWKTDKKTKIFAYLNEGYVSFSTLLTALTKCDAEILCVVNSTDERAEHLKAMYRQRTNIHITNVPVNLEAVIGNVNLYVGNAGLGVTTQMLVSGVPAAILPSTTEHHLFCIASEKQGLVKVIDPDLGLHGMAAMLQATIADTELQRHVRGLSNKYKHTTPSTAMSKIVATAEALLEVA